MDGEIKNITPIRRNLPPEAGRNAVIALIVLVALIVVGNLIFFSVDITEMAVKLQFGKVTGVYTKPGLHMKLPWQSVAKLPSNIVEFDAPPANVMTKDGKMIIVDNFAVWRVTDPVLFIKSAKSVGAAQTLLDDIVYSDLRSRMGQLTFAEVISEGRDKVLSQALDSAKRKMAKYGVGIIHKGLRTKRTDLPDENMQAVYDRMIADRKKIADRYKAEGKEQAMIIRSEADREAAELMAKAVEESGMIRGQADAEATKIYAEAYNRDPEFYDFLRHMEVMAKDLKGTLVLDKNSRLLKYLQ